MYTALSPSCPRFLPSSTPTPQLYRMSCPTGNNKLVPNLDPSPPVLFAPGKAFQNLSVSSPAPVTIVCPSGDMARYSTRNVCPVNVVTLVILGYLHKII